MHAAMFLARFNTLMGRSSTCTASYTDMSCTGNSQHGLPRPMTAGVLDLVASVPTPLGSQLFHLCGPAHAHAFPKPANKFVLCNVGLEAHHSPSSLRFYHASHVRFPLPTTLSAESTIPPACALPTNTLLGELSKRRYENRKLSSKTRLPN